MSVAFPPRNPLKPPVKGLRDLFGDDYYVCRFQEPGEIEEEIAQLDTAGFLRRVLTSRDTRPPCIPKEVGFKVLPDNPNLPSWLSAKDVDFYASKFSQTGFTGGLNYYRCIDRNWELMAPWTGAQIQVPVKFIVGDQDMTYYVPGVKEYIHNGGLKKYVPYLQDVVVLEGVAHFLNEEKPDEISAHIHDFIMKF